MKLRAYAVYDEKALIFMTPFFQATDAAAVRSMSDAVADVNSALGRHPSDYVLFFVGEYDDQNGAMHPVSPLVQIIRGSSLVQALQSEIPFPEAATTRTPSNLGAANGHVEKL